MRVLLGTRRFPFIETFSAHNTPQLQHCTEFLNYCQGYFRKYRRKFPFHVLRFLRIKVAPRSLHDLGVKGFQVGTQSFGDTWVRQLCAGNTTSTRGQALAVSNFSLQCHRELFHFCSSSLTRFHFAEFGGNILRHRDKVSHAFALSLRAA